MSIKLTATTESLIDKMMATGDYADASEVIEQAVRFLEASKRNERILRSVISAREAFARGEFYEDTDELWDSLEERAAELDRQGVPINPDAVPS